DCLEHRHRGGLLHLVNPPLRSPSGCRRELTDSSPDAGPGRAGELHPRGFDEPPVPDPRRRSVLRVIAVRGGPGVVPLTARLTGPALADSISRFRSEPAPAAAPFKNRRAVAYASPCQRLRTNRGRAGDRCWSVGPGGAGRRPLAF